MRKRSRYRPKMAGRPVMQSMRDAHTIHVTMPRAMIEVARHIGNGNISAGIRKALEKTENASTEKSR